MTSELPERLSRWNGGRTEVWDYTASHKVLRLKLSHDGADACAALYLFNCRRVAYFTYWADSAIVVNSLRSGTEERYRVTDGERLDVDCGAVELTRTFDSYAQIPHDHWRVRAREPLVPLSDAVRERVRELFAPSDRRHAEEILLHQCGLLMVLAPERTEEDLERLRLAVLRLSRGRLFDLSVAVARAETDSRLVLAAADA